MYGNCSRRMKFLARRSAGSMPSLRASTSTIRSIMKLASVTRNEQR